MSNEYNLYKEIALILKEPIIDKKEYEKLLNVTCDYFGLSEFLNNFNLITLEGFNDYLMTGSYNHLTKTLTINQFITSKCIEIYNEVNDVYPMPYNEFLLFHQLQNFFHEIGHVLQIKKINTPYVKKDDVIVKNILMDSYFLSDDLYDKSYAINPIEKEANVFSYTQVLKYLFRNSCDDLFKDYLIHLYVCMLKSGYIDSKFKHSNTKIFYRDILKKSNDYESYAKYFDLLSFRQKIMLNLPLNKKESANFIKFCNDECYNMLNSKKLIKKYLA